MFDPFYSIHLPLKDESLDNLAGLGLRGKIQPIYEKERRVPFLTCSRLPLTQFQLPTVNHGPEMLNGKP